MNLLHRYMPFRKTGNTFILEILAQKYQNKIEISRVPLFIRVAIYTQGAFSVWKFYRNMATYVTEDKDAYQEFAYISQQIKVNLHYDVIVLGVKSQDPINQRHVNNQKRTLDDWEACAAQNSQTWGNGYTLFALYA